MAREFLVDKSTVPVTVCLRSGRQLSGRFFVHAASQHHEGPESVADLLNEGPEFVPIALDEPAPCTVLVGLSQVRWVRAPRQQDVLQVLARAASTPVAVELELDDGSFLAGLLYIGLPPGQARTLDFVTQRSRFIRIVQPDREVFVHFRVIATVRDELPEWLEVPEPGSTVGVESPQREVILPGHDPGDEDPNSKSSG